MTASERFKQLSIPKQVEVVLATFVAPLPIRNTLRLLSQSIRDDPELAVELLLILEHLSGKPPLLQVVLTNVRRALEGEQHVQCRGGVI